MPIFIILVIVAFQIMSSIYTWRAGLAYEKATEEERRSSDLSMLAIGLFTLISCFVPFLTAIFPFIAIPLVIYYIFRFFFGK